MHVGKWSGGAQALVAFALVLPQNATAQERPGSSADSKLPLKPPASKSSGWEFEISPYVWVTGVHGTVGVRDRTAEVDVSFRKLLENLDGAIMLAVEGASGPWSVGIDLIYVNVSKQTGTPGPLFSSAELDVRQAIVEGSVRRRIVVTRRVQAGVLAGGRWWKLNNTLRLGAGALPGVDLDLDKGWIDPFVGGRVLADLSEHLVLQARADVGGFNVQSDFTWQALGTLGYRISDRVTARAGYRHLDVDYENDGFIYDIRMGGLIAGVTIAF